MEKRGLDISLFVLLIFIVLFFAFLLFAKPMEKINNTGMATFEWKGEPVGGANGAVGGTGLNGILQNKVTVVVVVGGIALLLMLIITIIVKKRKKRGMQHPGGEATKSVAADMGGGMEEAVGKDLGLSEEEIEKLFEEPNGRQQMSISPIEEFNHDKAKIKSSESKPMFETGKKHEEKAGQELMLDVEAPSPKDEAVMDKVKSIKAPYLGDVMTKIDSKIIRIDYKIIKAKIIQMLKDGFPMNRIVSVILEKGVNAGSINQAIAEINNDNLRGYLIACMRNGVGLDYANKALLSKGWKPEQIKKAVQVLTAKKK